MNGGWSVLLWAPSDFAPANHQRNVGFCKPRVRHNNHPGRDRVLAYLVLSPQT